MADIDSSSENNHPEPNNYRIQNLQQMIDPFAEADADTGDAQQSQNYIHIRSQQLPKVVGEHSMMAPKVARRELIERTATSSWIAVICNFWLDANIQNGLWGFDRSNRKAHIFKGADAKISTTTLTRTGNGIALLLSLPEAEFSQYKNRSFFISSFEVSQREIFEAIKRATGTKDENWRITEKDADEIIRECDPKIEDGDGFAEWTRLFVKFFQGMDGSNYEDKAVDLSRLGMPLESLDGVVCQAVAGL